MNSEASTRIVRVTESLMFASNLYTCECPARGQAVSESDDVLPRSWLAGSVCLNAPSSELSGLNIDGD